MILTHGKIQRRDKRNINKVNNTDWVRHSTKNSKNPISFTNKNILVDFSVKFIDYLFIN